MANSKYGKLKCAYLDLLSRYEKIKLHWLYENDPRECIELEKEYDEEIKYFKGIIDQ